jgi:cell division protein FtsB
MVQLWRRVVVVLVVLAIVAVMMLIITYSVPAVREIAQKLGGPSTIGVWLAGLIAPVIYLLRNLRGWLSNVLGSSLQERRITEENEKLREQLAQIRKDVEGIDSRHARELQERRDQLARLEGELAVLKKEGASMEARIQDLKTADPSQRGAQMTEKEVLEHFMGEAVP